MIEWLKSNFRRQVELDAVLCDFSLLNLLFCIFPD
jgi:hypothetical protein